MDLRWSDDAQRERGNEEPRSPSTVEVTRQVRASSGVVPLCISLLRLSCEPSAPPRGT